LAFFGTPLEELSENEAEEVFTGAMLVATGIDDLRTLRLRFEQFLEGLGKAAKARKR
jgi:hypothetical protein